MRSSWSGQYAPTAARIKRIEGCASATHLMRPVITSGMIMYVLIYSTQPRPFKSVKYSSDLYGSVSHTFILPDCTTIGMPDTREWFSTATELAEEGRYDEAIALLDQGIRIDANNANAWYNKGVVLFKMGRYQDALLAFAQATDIDPDFDQAWYNKGLALLRLRKYLEAIRAFDKALKLNPRDQEAQCQRDEAQRAVITLNRH